MVPVHNTKGGDFTWAAIDSIFFEWSPIGKDQLKLLQLSKG